MKIYSLTAIVVVSDECGSALGGIHSILRPRHHDVKNVVGAFGIWVEGRNRQLCLTLSAMVIVTPIISIAASTTGAGKTSGRVNPNGLQTYTTYDQLPISKINQILLLALLLGSFGQQEPQLGRLIGVHEARS